MNIILKITFFIFLFYFSSLITKLCLANIVVISYENFSNKDLNFSMLNEHIKILNNKKYYVLTTNNIIDAAISSKILPNYAVAITITSNKKQIINNVWPLLSKKSLPFTLFIDPHLISNSDNNMTW
jgi:hypothetical protein